MVSVMMQATTEAVQKGAGMTSEAVTTALGTIKDIVSWVVSFVSENPVLMVFFVGGLIPVGVHVFRSLKNSVQ